MWRREAIGAVRGAVAPLVRPHLDGTSPRPPFAWRLHVRPGLCLCGLRARIRQVTRPLLYLLICAFSQLRIFTLFSLIIKHVSIKTYTHQNLWNSLVINPIRSSVFPINGFYVGFWPLNLGGKDCQQPSPRNRREVPSVISAITEC